MKVLELISKLHDVMNEHGNIEVKCSDQNAYTENEPVKDILLMPHNPKKGDEIDYVILTT